jgi:penicillin-binding protein 1C
MIWLSRPLPAALLSANAAGVLIEDRNGVRLRSTRAQDGSNSRWVSYDQIDPDLINAFVAIEDKRFWEHGGVDTRAVARAARDNFRAKRIVSGASTITMQLARLVKPVPRTLIGKTREALWAMRLEHHLTKQQILEQYLNRVHLGQNAIGVSAATALYFKASPSELSLGEAATLAGLAHAPSRDNPHVSAPRARSRRNVVLARMETLGSAMREEIARARDEPFVSMRRTAPFLAPHFTTRVLAWTGAQKQNARDTSSVVATSLDLDLQREIEAHVSHTVDVLRDRGVVHAAVVVLDNQTGEVLAWVGSPDFWSPDAGQTDMVSSARQPGSALKPFLYGLALDREHTAASVIPDVPRSYATPTGPYQPRNYDRTFRGPTRIREALASSYNVPAVELAQRVGAANLLNTLHLAGFSSLAKNAEHYGLGLALGNGDVTLIEMANAYRALANGGEWRAWTWRRAPAVGAPHRVMSAVSSAIILDILRDPIARMPGFGVSTPFDFPFPVAVKTGTSRHFTDNWAVGTTRGFTVAVWAGNFSGKPMEGVSGVSGAGPLLHRVIMSVARRVSPGALTTPADAGAVSAKVCRLSGLLATRNCAQYAEWFAPGTVPTKRDDWEQRGRVVLPDEYAEWSLSSVRAVASVEQTGDEWASGGSGEGANADSVAKNASSDDDDKTFRIISPMNGDRYSIPPGMEARYATIPFRAGGVGADAVKWLVDGNPVVGGRWSLVPGEHTVSATSARGERVKVRITVEGAMASAKVTHSR